MGPRIYSEYVPRPPDVVWAFLSDLRNDSRWRGEIKHVDLIEGAPGAAGSRYVETVEWQGTRSEVTLEAEESVKGRRLVVVSNGPGYRSRSSWTFEPRAGGTLVTLVFSLDTEGALVLVTPLVRGLVEGWLERDLPRLQGHLSTA